MEFKPEKDSLLLNKKKNKKLLWLDLQEVSLIETLPKKEI